MAASKFTGGFDTRYTQFWADRYRQEAYINKKWFEKYFKKIYDELPKDMRSSKGDELIEKLTEQRKVNLQNAHKLRAFVRHPEPLPLPESDPSVNLQTMRPVSPQDRDLLYKGISHENEGRWAYLQKRYKLKPTERFVRNLLF